MIYRKRARKRERKSSSRFRRFTIVNKSNLQDKSHSGATSSQLLRVLAAGAVPPQPPGDTN